MDRSRVFSRRLGRSAPLAALVLAVALAGCRSEPQPATPEADVEVPEADVGAPEAEPTAPGVDAEAVDPGQGAFPSLGTDADGLAETVVRVTADSGTHDVRAKVADTDVDRQRGLMGVRDLPDGTGMLFLFDEDRTGGFWMRNTLVPLDIAYVGADGTIGSILAMDPCDAPDAGACPIYAPAGAYRVALEVPQGWFASVGVAAGDEISWDEPEPSTVAE